MNSPTPQSQPPRDSNIPARQEFAPGVEIASAHFVTRLSPRDTDDPHISFEIFLREENGDRKTLKSASSHWFVDLIDCLELVERKIRRDGPERNAQVLGSCMGVRVGYVYDETSHEETRIAQLMTEDDENWHVPKNSFSPDFVSELREHCCEVLDIMRSKALPDSKGYGFEFRVA